MINKIEIYEYKKAKSIYIMAYNSQNSLEYFLREDILPVTQNEAIYLTKVSALNKGNKTAFVNYTDNREGFLNISKNNNLQNGSLVVSQVKWLGNNEKQVKLSDSILFIGKYVILTQNIGHTYSCDKSKFNQLNSISDKYKDYGIIFRTSINDLTDIKLVRQELELLIEKMHSVQQKLRSTSKVTCVYSGTPLYMQVLRSLKLDENLEIVTNSEAVFNQIKPYVDLWQINQMVFTTKFIVGLNNILGKININDITHDNFSLEIHQLSGINLIDINSKASKLSFYQVNYLALDEIIYQIKLRDLTGIILLDLIKNMTDSEKTNITAKLGLLLRDDWRKNKCLGFTNAGMFEIIRNK